MGPHSFECGNPPRLVRETGTIACASMGPHSFECGNGGIRGRRRPSHDASMGPHSFECGNLKGIGRALGKVGLQWGRTRSSAEISDRARSCTQCRASMGPHSFECGNRRPARLPRSSARRFNGAALVRVRKFADRDGFVWASLRFNGAALVRVRKFGLAWPRCAWRRWLQWGRTRSSAEIRGNHMRRPPLLRASMGPHSFECGNS